MIRRFFCSTVGRKQLVAVCGLAFTGFVLSHALGNFLIFAGDRAYNLYSHALTSNPLIYLAEVGLVLFFVLHFVTAMVLSRENALAKPESYSVSAAGSKATSLVTKTMKHQGVLILLFIIFHLYGFKFGPGLAEGYVANYDGVEVRDIYRLVAEKFQDPVYVGGYLTLLVVLFFHLGHGVGSALQTLGVHHPEYSPKFKGFSWALAAFIALGFASQPLFIYFFRVSN